MPPKSNRKNSTTVEVYRNLVLPQLLLDEIEALNLTKAYFNKALHVIYLLSTDPTKDRSNLNEFYPLSKSYLILKLGTNYNLVVNPLRESGIIQCDEVFYKGKGDLKGKAFHYRINPLFTIDSEVVKVKFKYRSNVDLELYHKNKVYDEKFKEDFGLLKIPFDKLEKAIDEKMNSLKIEDYLIGEAIRWEGTREVDFTEYDSLKPVKRWMVFDEAIKASKVEGRLLIKDKNKIFCLHESDFLTHKKTYIQHAYLQAVESLRDEKTLRAERNTTNNRLDTNFTNFPKCLLDIIHHENNIVEFDLKNSQPVLLGFFMEKECIQGPDLMKFCQVVYDGTFYEIIAKEIGLNRGQAKSMMFEVLFSAPRLNSKEKKLFKRLFPTVWRFTCDYKNKYGKNMLAIKLQRMESDLFIDNIYLRIRNEGVPLFTKHDSVACFEKDAMNVKEFIQKYFDHIGFKGTIESSKPLADLGTDLNPIINEILISLNLEHSF